MKYTVRTYAKAKRVTPREVFRQAWLKAYKQDPGYRITEEVIRYEKFGAVPPYVSFFLEKEESEKIFDPNYLPYWAQIA